MDNINNEQLDPRLEEIMEIFSKAKKAMMGSESDQNQCRDDIIKYKSAIIALLEYLIMSSQSIQNDLEIIGFMCKLLGIDLNMLINKIKTSKEQEKNKEEQRLTKNDEKILKSLIIYEMYKWMTPNAVAGKTPIQTFIGNVHRYGIVKALMQENTLDLHSNSIPEGIKQDIAKICDLLKNSKSKKEFENKLLDVLIIDIKKDIPLEGISQEGTLKNTKSNLSNISVILSNNRAPTID